MKTIRLGCWETNSSSTHTLAIGNPIAVVLNEVLKNSNFTVETEALEEEAEFQKSGKLVLDNSLGYPDYGESERDYRILIAKTTVGKLKLLWNYYIKDIDTYDLPVEKMLEQENVQLFIKHCSDYLSFKDGVTFDLVLQPSIGNPFRYKDRWTTAYDYGNLYFDNEIGSGRSLASVFYEVMHTEALVATDSPYGGLNDFTHINIKII